MNTFSVSELFFILCVSFIFGVFLALIYYFIQCFLTVFFKLFHDFLYTKSKNISFRDYFKEHLNYNSPKLPTVILEIFNFLFLNFSAFFMLFIIQITADGIFRFVFYVIALFGFLLFRINVKKIAFKLDIAIFKLIKLLCLPLILADYFIHKMFLSKTSN